MDPSVDNVILDPTLLFTYERHQARIFSLIERVKIHVYTSWTCWLFISYIVFHIKWHLSESTCRSHSSLVTVYPCLAWRYDLFPWVCVCVCGVARWCHRPETTPRCLGRTLPALKKLSYGWTANFCPKVGCSAVTANLRTLCKVHYTYSAWIYHGLLQFSWSPEESNVFSV